MKKTPRQWALQSLMRLQLGETGPEPSSAFSGKDERFISHLIKGVFRFRGYLDQEIGKASTRPLEKLDPVVLNLLRLSSFELFFSRSPAYAVIHESVEIAKATQPKGASFVNAILRKISQQEPAGSYDLGMLMPLGLTGVWKKILTPTQLSGTIQNLSSPGKITARTNILHTDRDTLMKAVKDEGLLVEPGNYFDNTFYIGSPSASRSRCFQKGLFYIQNESAQVPTMLLDPQPGEEILDLCAAPGGKTTHIAELTQNRAQITAVDRSSHGLTKIKENLQRLGCEGISIHQEDVAKTTFSPRRSYDRILVDAPCSSWGVLASHPEWRWTKDPDSPKGYAKTQSAILNQAAKLLKSGGILVYSVCTFSPEETREVISSFLKTNDEFKLDPPGSFLPPTLHPFIDEDLFSVALDFPPLDGFFAARLRKS